MNLFGKKEIKELKEETKILKLRVSVLQNSVDVLYEALMINENTFGLSLPGSNPFDIKYNSIFKKIDVLTKHLNCEFETQEKKLILKKKSKK